MRLPQDPHEPLPVVDAQDRLLGLAPRHEIHARGLLHRAVHVLVFTPQGRLYLQRRALTKDTHPGKWTSSASGHLDPGETYDQAARREAREELGLNLRPAFLSKIPAQAATGNEFTGVYLVTTKEEPKPNLLEISELRFFVRQEAMALARDPKRAAPSLGAVLALVEQEGAWPLVKPPGKREKRPAAQNKKASK